MTLTKKRACVIGAGPAGIPSLRHLAELKDSWDIVAYEKEKEIGGQWVFQPVVDGHANSSMYKNLRTNLPKEIMNYPDYLFPNDKKSFVHRSVVLKYINDYAKKHNLFNFIKFRHEVIKVDEIKTGNPGNWEVTVRDLDTDKSSSEHFDVVFVCNGHYIETFIPQIKGMETFKGDIIHSHVYRDPADFIGKRCACIGAGPSGMDISLELADFADKVYLCHRKESIKSELPTNLCEKPAIVEFREKTVVFANGETAELDIVIFCTGYAFAFPFLDSSNFNLKYNQKGISNLYQHIVFIDNPTLFFIGLPVKTSPLPIAYIQAEFCVQLMKNAAKLPSAEQMKTWEKADLERRAADPELRRKEMHYLGSAQFEYVRELAKLGNFKCKVTLAYEKLYEHVFPQSRQIFVTTFKNFNYRFISENEFEQLD